MSQTVHFVGIGGVGMAGIAEVLLNLNYRVSGSDIKETPLIKHLKKCGADIYIGHKASNLPDDASVVVTSSALSGDNIEVITALERGIPVIPRAEMLSELMRMKYGIAVAGSHGKTTTTSMTAKVLADAGLDPTVVVGGRILNQMSGARLGLGQYLIAEADESDGSFCLLRPAIAVVTNIDVEHLGHYGSFGLLENAFLQFMSAVPFYGLVVACFDDPVVANLAKQLKRRVISYGLTVDCDVGAKDVRIENGKSNYTLVLQGIEIGEVELPMPGIHLVSNSLAAFCVGLELGVYPQEIIQALSTFPGVSRRTEVVGEIGGIRIIDDYAHHPTEITKTLEAVRESWLANARGKIARGENERLIAIFQPHRYTRTKELFSEFLRCFSAADEVIIGDIYAAGEQELPGISGEGLAKAVDHRQVSYVKDLSDAVSGLCKSLKPGDVVVTLGAGNVGQVAYQLCDKLGEKSNGSS